MSHIQTQIEWEEEMSLKILTFIRNEIYMDLRFLDIALSALTPKADPVLKAFATDGAYLYFSTEHLLRVFKTNALYQTNFKLAAPEDLWGIRRTENRNFRCHYLPSFKRKRAGRIGSLRDRIFYRRPLLLAEAGGQSGKAPVCLRAEKEVG